MNILIAVVAYNRPQCLKRILDSLSKSVYSNITDLVISIDYSGESHCTQIANDFEWKFGNKKVIVHPKNLGLRKHIFYCGELVTGYDGIIMLEDDLWVSPNFYQYVVEADSFFKNDVRIGQISLYSFQYDEFSFSRFIPLKQSGDNYFMQVPSSWGQYWSREQWNNFKLEYDQGMLEINEDTLLPNHVIEHWPGSSWKKYFYNYLIKNNLFVVYPYFSFSTNFGEIGTHYTKKIRYMQSIIGYDQFQFSFRSLDMTSVAYDYNFELHSISIRHFFNKDFQGLDVEFDLNGTKDLNKVKSKYLISSKFCENPIQQFGDELLPQEVNVFAGIKGEFYSFGKTQNFKPNNCADKVVDRNIKFLPYTIKNRIENGIKKLYQQQLIIRIAKKIGVWKNVTTKN